MHDTNCQKYLDKLGYVEFDDGFVVSSNMYPSQIAETILKIKDNLNEDVVVLGLIINQFCNIVYVTSQL
jgi:hypothetical protein